MRDEIEIVRSLGAGDRAPATRAVAQAQDALRHEMQRERDAAARVNGGGAAAFAHRPPRVRGGRHRRRWVLGLVVPVAIIAGGATYALTRSSVNYAAGFGCYDRVSLNADVAVPGGDASNPVAACAAVWRQGAMGRQVSAGVPAQTACVLPSGAVGVFPSGDPGTCARLGLARLPADYQRQAARFNELASAVRGVIDPVGGRCLTAAQAHAVASRELAALGFDGWRVRVPVPFAAGKRCAGVGFGQWQRTAYIISTPREAPSLAAARHAFAAAHMAVDPSTITFLAGAGAYAAYAGSSQPGGAPCVVVLGARAPKIACPHESRITSIVVRLVDGNLLVAGSISPVSAADDGVQVRLDHGPATGLAVSPDGAFAGPLPTGSNARYGRLVALDRAGRPAASARIALVPPRR